MPVHNREGLSRIPYCDGRAIAELRKHASRLMDTTTPEWIKQENAIPALIAHQAVTALQQRVSTLALPSVATTPRIMALSLDGDDAESDVELPGVHFLRAGDHTALRHLSSRMLRPDVRTWPFMFTGATGTAAEGGSFVPAAMDRMWTIIALQIVTYGNGLPALGARQERTELSPGDALHFSGAVAQTYSGHGGGLCTMIEWRYY